MFGAFETKRSKGCEMINKYVRNLEDLAGQTAVHRKKFEFALSQVRKLANAYSSRDQTAVIPTAEIEAIKTVVIILTKLQELLNQHLFNSWTITVISNQCGYVLDKLKNLLGQLRDAIQTFDKELASIFETETEEWDRFNILDLRAISASFTQFLQKNSSDHKIAQLIFERLQSIKSELEKSGNDDVNRQFSPLPIDYRVWTVKLSDFQFIKQIGKGISAIVFTGTDLRTNKKVAIKRFTFNKLNGARFQSYQREVAALANANHPTLLKMIGATDELPFCIITEWMPNDSLYHDLHHNFKLNQTDKSIVAYDIARGMQYLHSHQIVHRDLKSLNVLLDENLHAKVADFGFSRRTADGATMTSNMGTPHWMAPELFQNQASYTSKVDVYAYGIVLWEIATGLTPYQGLEPKEIVYKVSHDNSRPAIPTGLNPYLDELIRKCWDRNPDKRPSFDEILKFFKQFNICFPGANAQLVQKYISENATSVEQQMNILEEFSKQILNNEISMSDYLAQINKTGKPPGSENLIFQTVQTLIPKITEFSDYDVAGRLLLKVKDFKLKETAAIIRGFPSKSLSAEVMADFIYDLPTGSEITDMDITVAACKNGSANLCAVYSVNSKVLGFALDESSRNQVDPLLREALIDKCSASLIHADTYLVSSALRCLLILGEVRRITFSYFLNHFESKDATLSSLAYLSLLSAALNNITIPDFLILHIINNYNNDKRARHVAAGMCKSKNIAEHILNSFLITTPVVTNDLVKLLLMSAQHQELYLKIKEIVDLIDFSTLSSRANQAIEKLHSLLINI